jgi:hypothetical protein
MKQAIIIDDVELNLDVDTVISVTKRIANIGSLERQSSFTNKLSIPNTSTNREAAGMAQGNDSSTKKYSRQIGQVTSNGNAVMSQAEMLFESVGDRLSLLINADNSVFFDLVSKTKLRSIDMTELDHVWNMQNEFDSKANTWTDGYIYGICDTGNQSRTINNLQCQGVPPSVFAKYLFNTIGNYFGYTFIGSWWSHPMFDDLVISIVEARTGARIISDVSLIVTKTANQSFGSANNVWNRVKNFNAPAADLWDVWNFHSDSAYEIKFPGKYTFTARFETDVTVNLPGDPLSIAEAKFRIKCVRVVDGVATLLGEDVLVHTGTGAFDGTVTIDIEITDQIVSTQNSQIFVSMDAYQREGATGLPSDPYYRTLIEVDYVRFSVENVVAPLTHYNRPISIQDSLPDWTCGTLIKEICNIAGVLPIVDEYDKTIRLMMLNEISDNKTIARQWQDKIDLTRKPEFTFKADGYGRKMNFSYKGEIRYAYNLLVDNEQLPEEVNYINSAFLYSNSINILGKNFFCSRFVIWDNEKGLIKWDKNCYINMIQRRVTGVTYTSYFEPNLNAVGGTAFPFLEFSTQANYKLTWTALYQYFYEKLMSGIVDGILQVDMDFRLTENDINFFDFSIPIYLNNPSGLYYVQSIKDFTSSEESASVELIRIG